MALEELARMPDPTTVFLVRHGQTDWVAKGIGDGSASAPRIPARPSLFSATAT